MLFRSAIFSFAALHRQILVVFRGFLLVHPDFHHQLVGQEFDTQHLQLNGKSVDREVLFGFVEVFQACGYHILGLVQVVIILNLTVIAGQCMVEELRLRDIIWMQNCKYNLEVRKVLENILENYKGDRTCENWAQFETYAKRVFFSNGIHHHYSEDKFFPECSQEYFQSLMAAVGDEDKSSELIPVIFDPAIYPARKDMHAEDIVAASAVNFYENVTRAEVEALYAAMADPSDKTPVSYGLNSRVVKGEDGKVYEDVYKVGGLYGAALEKICEELELAAEVAENQTQKAYIADLIAYYQTGDLKLWDKYNIQWVNDTLGTVETRVSCIGRQVLYH